MSIPTEGDRGRRFAHAGNVAGGSSFSYSLRKTGRSSARYRACKEVLSDAWDNLGGTAGYQQTADPVP